MLNFRDNCLGVRVCFMQFRRAGRFTEAPTVVDVSLEDRNVHQRPLFNTPFANGASIQRLPRAEELQTGESSESIPRHPQSDQLNPTTTNNQTNISVHSPFLHPGVVKLLEEYYKLLETASVDRPIVKSNRYRPSIMTKFWKLLTIALPTPLQFGQFLRHIKKLVRWIAPSSTTGIIISLLLWLVIIQLIMKWPFLCLVTFLLGVYCFLVSEEKYKKVLLNKMMLEVRLEEFRIGQDLGQLPAVAKEYVKVQHHRRVREGTHLNALEWPEHLQKPNNCVKEEIKEIQKDIHKLRNIVMGPEKQKSVNSDATTSFESAISTVQELCALVGVDQLSGESKDWESLRNKLQELQEELGFDSPL